MTEDRRQRTEDRGQRTEDRRQMTDDGGQKTEKSVIGHRSSVLHLPGFSLIELLVVISIIAAVLAMLVPCLGTAKRFAKRTQCALNLHQINVAFHLYAGSNDDKYPCAQDNNSTPWLWMGRGFRKLITPYLGGHIDGNNPSVLWCIVDKTSQEKYESTSYAYSMAFYHSPEQIDTNGTTDYTSNPALIKPSIPQKSVNVKRPSEKILAGEWLSNHYLIKNGNDSGWWCLAGRRNYLFADGHVQFLRATEIHTANDGNPNPNLTKNGIKGTDLW
jgi:prepilin-type N-terminal cleavage/methylation domain-containing protein/prepilin-type processing-associated H-X9-DG protein